MCSQKSNIHTDILYCVMTNSEPFSERRELRKQKNVQVPSQKKSDSKNSHYYIEAKSFYASLKNWPIVKQYKSNHKNRIGLLEKMRVHYNVIHEVSKHKTPKFDYGILFSTYDHVFKNNF